MAQVTEMPRAMEIVVSESTTIFTDEELQNISGFVRGPIYIEVTCGCSSKRYGNSFGKLRVYATGQFLISCDCIRHCPAGWLTPVGFLTHTGREGPKNWKSSVWVSVNNKKVPLSKTVLLKYYRQASNEANVSRSSRIKQFHRDEFVRCSRCQKERRFFLRTKEECRVYHDTLAKRNWKCTDWPYGRISCHHDEERGPRKVSRSCPRLRTCEGCRRCVCFGCLSCRFRDCNCHTCVDFISNA